MSGYTARMTTDSSRARTHRRAVSVVVAGWTGLALAAQVVYTVGLVPILPAAYTIGLAPFRGGFVVETANLVAIGWIYAAVIGALAVFSIVASHRGDVVGGFGTALAIALAAPVGAALQLGNAAVELLDLNSSLPSIAVVIGVALGLATLFIANGRFRPGI